MSFTNVCPLVVPTRVNQVLLTGNPISRNSPVTEASNEDSLFLTWPQAMLLWGRYVLFVQMCMSARCELFLADVIRWTWRRGKGTPDHPTRMRGGLLWKGGCMYMFVCAMSHGYVAKGCTAHLCDVLQACYPILCSHILFSPPLPLLSPSLPLPSPTSPLLSPLPLLFFFPLFHFLLQLFAPR